MTVVAGHKESIARYLVSIGSTLLVLLPSLATALGLLNGALPLQLPLKVSCLILFLASVNIGAAIMLEPYRRHFSKLSLPAVIGMAATVFLYVIFEALKTYFQQISYGFLTPFAVISASLIYAAIIREKSLPLKALLSLDSIALMFLWALGASDKFTMPF